MRQPTLLKRNRYGGTYSPGRSYGVVIDTRVREYYEDNKDISKTAAHFQVSPLYVQKVVRQEPIVKRKRGRPRRQIDRWFLWWCLIQLPSLFLWEMQVLLFMRQGEYFSMSTICAELKDMRMNRKVLMHCWTERRRQDIREARAAWAEWQRQLTPEDLSRLIFLDETSVNNQSFCRTYGRGYEGQRVRGEFPKAKRNRVSAICAVGWDGLKAFHIVEGSANAEDFTFFMMHCLLPVLQDKSYIVIMDNCKIHHAVPDVEAAYELLGHEWRFLPAYSPDLNPIENMFSKLKILLTYRRWATESHPMEAVAEALGLITTENIRGWYRLCNYK